MTEFYTEDQMKSKVRGDWGLNIFRDRTNGEYWASGTTDSQRMFEQRSERSISQRPLRSLTGTLHDEVVVYDGVDKDLVIELVNEAHKLNEGTLTLKDLEKRLLKVA